MPLHIPIPFHFAVFIEMAGGPQLPRKPRREVEWLSSCPAQHSFPFDNARKQLRAASLLRCCDVRPLHRMKYLLRLIIPFLFSDSSLKKERVHWRFELSRRQCNTVLGEGYNPATNLIQNLFFGAPACHGNWQCSEKTKCGGMEKRGWLFRNERGRKYVRPHRRRL